MATQPGDLRFNSLGCIVLPAALFAGLMISTAGMALYPPVTFVADPLICSGTIDYVSTSYSYRPGQQGLERTIYCVADGPKGPRQDVTMKAIGVSFLVYSALFFLILGFIVRPLLRRRLARAVAAVRERQAVTGSIAGVVTTGMQDVMQRVSRVIGQRGATVVAGNESGDLAERLAKLKQLRDEGLITAEDYEAKKAELLSRL